MTTKRKSTLFIFAVSTLFALSSLAGQMIFLQGKVKQIKDGSAEIRSKDGSNWVVLKKLPKDARELVMKAMRDQRDIQISVSPEMMAKN